MPAPRGPWATSRNVCRLSALTRAGRALDRRRNGPARADASLPLTGEGLTSKSTSPAPWHEDCLGNAMIHLPPRTPRATPPLTTPGPEIHRLGRGRVSGSSSSSDAHVPSPSLTAPGAEIHRLVRGRGPNPERATRTLSDHYGHGVPDLLPALEDIHAGKLSRLISVPVVPHAHS